MAVLLEQPGWCDLCRAPRKVCKKSGYFTQAERWKCATCGSVNVTPGVDKIRDAQTHYAQERQRLLEEGRDEHGMPLRTGAGFCTRCGTPLPLEGSFCPACGKETTACQDRGGHVAEGQRTPPQVIRWPD